jgi:hypothetical protein
MKAKSCTNECIGRVLEQPRKGGTRLSSPYLSAERRFGSWNRAGAMEAWCRVDAKGESREVVEVGRVKVVR